MRHKLYSFRGIIFDVDPEFNNTEEWYQNISRVCPTAQKISLSITCWQKTMKLNMLPMFQNKTYCPMKPVSRSATPQVNDMFVRDDDGNYALKSGIAH